MHWVQILDRVYAECRLSPGTLCTRPLQHTDKRSSREFTLPRCEYPGEWLWATPRSGLTLLPRGP